VNEERSVDLGELFGAALHTIEEKRTEINDLDGYNGNHGDNMVQNMRVIRDVVAAHEGEPPSEALRFAGQELARRGQGGTSQYYVRGLNQAADQLEGHTEMRQGEVMTLVQSLLGSVPQQGHPQQMQSGGSVLDQMLGMAGNQVAAQTDGSPLGAFVESQQGQAPGGGSGSPLDAFLGGQGGSGGQGGLGGLGAFIDQAMDQDQPQESGSAAPSLLESLLGGQGQAAPQGGAQGGGLASLLGGGGASAGGGGLGSLLGMLTGSGGATGGGQEQGAGDMMQMLLPAALAFLQAKQSGAETPQAAGQALLAVLAGGQINPMQSGAPRPAAGGLIAQSLMQAFMNR
jgi:hypothetical protein